MLHPAPQRHPVRFSATGSEYFRVWIVNLLLTVVTFGIYSPWAKVRTLRYFYQHTAIDGHSLDFHGNPRRMFRGMMVVAVFLVVYQYASGFSVWAALVAAAAFCAVWPTLFLAGQRFRLAHTSWRGLRFSFVGDTAGAYRAVGVPLAAFLLPAAGLGVVMGSFGEQDPASELAVLLYGAVLLAVLVAVPYFFYRIKSYQHGAYAMGALRTEFRTTARTFYGVFGAAFGLWLVLVVAAATSVWAGGWRAGFLAVLAVFVLGYWLLIPYVKVRLQNLVWSRTGNRLFRFKSELSVKRFIMLSLKNWLLMVCTLGLYYPWAAVAVRRLRLEAVSLHARMPLNELTAVGASAGDAAGDAAGDLMGLDVGV